MSRKINTKKRNSKRSRAITCIINDHGYEYWHSLSIRKKEAAIKSYQQKHKESAKKGRKFIKDLNRELRGCIKKAA